MRHTSDPELDEQLRLFGESVRLERRRAGLTQIDLAAAADLDRAAIGFLERAERAPELSTLLRVARALGLEPAELLRGAGSRGVDLPQVDSRDFDSRGEWTLQTGKRGVQTGKGRVQTGKGRVQTGKRRVQTGKRRVQTGKRREVSTRAEGIPRGYALQFGAALRRARMRAGVSQQALALRADVDRAAISVYERGARAPNLRTILKLARALSVRPEALL